MEEYIVKGDFCHSAPSGALEAFKDAYLVVLGEKIKGLFKDIPEGYKSLTLYDYSGKLIIPGLYDLHLHAPQYGYRGLWMDKELIDWLNSHTFPQEAKYADLEFAEKAYAVFVDDLLHSASARFSLFSTIHTDSALLLCQMLDKVGLKGFVGKVNMDQNSPSYLSEDTEKSIKDTLRFIEGCNFDNVKPIITPRFAPSCSERLLRELGEIAKAKKLPVQSHLSENIGEIEWVRTLHPSSSCYGDVYRRYGLFSAYGTIMAHCVYTEGIELEMLKRHGVFIAHCPDSNGNLYSGIAPVKKFINEGGKVALGSDVAGGTSLSIFKAATDAVKVSKLRYRLLEGEEGFLSFAEAFKLATTGGGAFFGKCGAFREGYEADWVVLDEDGIKGPLFETFSIAERLERYAYLAPERPALHKAVGGKRLF